LFDTYGYATGLGLESNGFASTFYSYTTGFYSTTGFGSSFFFSST